MSAEPELQPEARAAASLAAADDNSSDSDSSDSDSTPQPTTEWLATTREKRSTAGNRMKSMLAQEEPDSDLELLFAEDEDDQGFSDAGADASDVHMDSSSDDEDDNNAAADDMEGEKELERQAKEKKAAQRKRKAQDAIPAKFRKKVRINPTTTTSAASTPTSTATAPGAPPPRPKKKSERASWLPAVADMPTRASSRQTTRHSKEQLHAQMEEREARRLKQLEQMQKKQARLEALKKPPMTQEERLREAEIVEKRNSKSLNRWEEAEKQREEERKAKLAALNERTLKGPVITFWSGTRQWKDGGAAKYVVMEEKPKRKERKPKDKSKEKEKDKDKDKKKDGDKDDGDGQAVAVENAEGNDAKEFGTPSADAPKATSEARFVLKEKDDAISNPAAGEPSQLLSEGEPKQQSQDAPAKASPEHAQEVSQEVPQKQDQEQQGTTPPDPTTQPQPKQSSDPSPSDLERSAGVDDSPGQDTTMSDAAPVMAMPSMPPPLSPPPPPSQPSQLSQPTQLSQPVTQPQPQSTTTSGLAAPSQAQAPSISTESLPGEYETKPSGVLAAPVLAPPAGFDAERISSPAPKPQEAPTSNILAPPNTSPDAHPPAIPKDETAAPAQSDIKAQTVPEDTNATDKADGAEPTEAAGQTDAAETSSTRNTIVYQNFDENAIKDKTIQTQILFGRKMNKLPSASFSFLLPIECISK